MITKEIFFILAMFFTAVHCSEYLFASIMIILFKLVKGLICCIRSMLQEFSVSIKIILPGLLAVI